MIIKDTNNNDKQKILTNKKRKKNNQYSFDEISLKQNNLKVKNDENLINKERKNNINLNQVNNKNCLDNSRLIITGDYHTHTIYSHGKGDIIDNANFAKEKNLKQLAITDHGFSLFLYGVKREKLSEMKEKIKLAEKQTNLKIYLGVEANFTSCQGDVDVNLEDLKILDILLVGHHRMVKSRLIDKLKLFIPNMIFKNKAYKKLKERNTETVLKAMEKYPIDILTHLNYEMPLDINKIAKKAFETGTYIEINDKKMYFTEEEIKTLIENNVMFILDSDAHKPEHVGIVPNSLQVVEKFNIPIKNIANINKLPVFKKFRKIKNNYEQIDL